MAKALEPRKTDRRQQVPDVKARAGRVEAVVGRHRFAFEDLREPFRAVVDETPPVQFRE
jgi:hypothetical protein